MEIEDDFTNRIITPTDGLSIGARILRTRSNSVENHHKKSSKRIAANEKKMDAKAIEKLYLNKDLGRMKATPLETIFEHEDEYDVDDSNSSDSLRVFGDRKIPRIIKFPDQFKPNKGLKKKRKDRANKLKNDSKGIGMPKKIRVSMKFFKEYLEADENVTFTSSKSTVTTIKTETTIIQSNATELMVN